MRHDHSTPDVLTKLGNTSQTSHATSNICIPGISLSVPPGCRQNRAASPCSPPLDRLTGLFLRGFGLPRPSRTARADLIHRESSLRDGNRSPGNRQPLDDDGSRSQPVCRRRPPGPARQLLPVHALMHMRAASHATGHRKSQTGVG
jgi:hypothetical protein